MWASEAGDDWVCRLQGNDVIMRHRTFLQAKHDFNLFTRNYPLKTQFAWATCSGRDTALPLFALNPAPVISARQLLPGPEVAPPGACDCSQLDPGQYPDHISGKAKASLASQLGFWTWNT